MMVDIYGTESCVYCKHAVALCEANALEYNYVDVGNSVNLQNLIERMGVRPRTVPQIFLNGTYLPDGFNGLKQELDKRQNMSKRSPYDEDDFDYDEEDDKSQGNHRYKKEKEYDKKKHWERESVPDFDDYDRR